MTKEESLKVFGSTDYKFLTDPERTVFRSTVEELMERDLFKMSDVPVIASYSRNVVLARTASKDVQKLGTVIKFYDRGCEKYKTNPAVDIMNKAQMAYESTAIKLGLTPTGRKRVPGNGGKKSDLDNFIEEMNNG